MSVHTVMYVCMCVFYTVCMPACVCIIQWCLFVCMYVYYTLMYVCMYVKRTWANAIVCTYVCMYVEKPVACREVESDDGYSYLEMQMFLERWYFVNLHTGTRRNKASGEVRWGGEGYSWGCVTNAPSMPADRFKISPANGNIRTYIHGVQLRVNYFKTNT